MDDANSMSLFERADQLGAPLLVHDGTLAMSGGNKRAVVESRSTAGFVDLVVEGSIDSDIVSGQLAVDHELADDAIGSGVTIVADLEHVASATAHASEFQVSAIVDGDLVHEAERGETFRALCPGDSHDLAIFSNKSRFSICWNQKRVIRDGRIFFAGRENFLDFPGFHNLGQMKNENQ